MLYLVLFTIPYTISTGTGDRCCGLTNTGKLGSYVGSTTGLFTDGTIAIYVQFEVTLVEQKKTKQCNYVKPTNKKVPPTTP